jgi:hypothetical protein
VAASSDESDTAGILLRHLQPKAPSPELGDSLLDSFLRAQFGVHTVTSHVFHLLV